MILDAVILYINQQIRANLCEKYAEFHGLTLPTTKDGKVFPVEDCEPQAPIIIFDDRSAVVRVYHRLIACQQEPVAGYGNDKAYRFTFRLEMFALGIRGKLSECMGNAATFGVTIDSCLPKNANLEAEGVKGLNLEFRGFNCRSDEIMQNEYRGHHANLLNPLQVTAAVWEYTLSGIACEDLCSIDGLVVN